MTWRAASFSDVGEGLASDGGSPGSLIVMCDRLRVAAAVSPPGARPRQRVSERIDQPAGHPHCHLSWMPFTLSHPAAAALFRRGGLPLAALVVGTMAPDFEYLLRLEPMAYWSHSLAGLFVFCLPAGWVALLVWQLLLRQPVRHLLRLPAEAERESRNSSASVVWVAQATLALLLGSASHLFWDGFTHWDGWGVALFPALNRPVLHVAGYAIPWYKVLQHVSTVMGGCVVVVWLGRALGGLASLGAIARSSWRRRTLGAVALMALAIAAWNATGSGEMREPSPATIAFGRAAVGALAGLALGLIGYGVAYRGAVAFAGRQPGE